MKSLTVIFFEAESGTTAIEYGLIAALISVVCILGMTLVGTQLTGVYTFVSNAVTPALTGG
jgi:pilus assembly protein Flp/PilA